MFIQLHGCLFSKTNLIIQQNPDKMDFLTKTLSRFLFSVPILIFGLFHFMNTQAMAGMVPQWIPGSAFWVILTGIALIAAAVGIMARVWDYWAGFLLGIMLLIFALTIHLPAAIGGDQMGMTMLLKDTAMAAGAWMYAGYLARRI